MPKNKKPKNADEPYDRFEIVKEDDGTYRAVFYNAAIRRRFTRDWPADILETLVSRQKHFRELGYVSPVTDDAIRHLREAMNLPTLQ